MEIEKRLDQLEIRYTFLEDKLETLNGVIIEKDQEISVLKNRIVSLEQALASAMETPHTEKPPHY